MRDRVRRLTDLFVDGRAITLPDGSHLWIQVVNSYERDECISDAQVARARLVMALRQNGSERIKIEARLAEHGRDQLVRDMATTKTWAKQGEFLEDMRADPDWKDRVEILLRTDPESAAKPLTPEEQTLMDRINREVIDEIADREQKEHDFLVRKYERMSDDELVDEWVEYWLDKRGSELATQEFRLTEMTYAARFCEAETTSDGELDHTRCGGHMEHVFGNKGEARSAPNRLQEIIREALADLNVVGLDPKGSGSPQSSSGSPPSPNEEAESTPSTSTPIPAGAPGT